MILQSSVRMPEIGQKAYKMVDGKVCAVRCLEWCVQCLDDDGSYPTLFHYEQYCRYRVTTVWQVAGRQDPQYIPEVAFASSITMPRDAVYSTPEAFRVADRRQYVIHTDAIPLLDLIKADCAQLGNEFEMAAVKERIHYRPCIEFFRWFWDGGMPVKAYMTFKKIVRDKNGLRFEGLQFIGKNSAGFTWENTYPTKAACEAANTLQVVEFEDALEDNEDEITLNVCLNGTVTGTRQQIINLLEHGDVNDVRFDSGATGYVPSGVNAQELQELGYSSDDDYDF